MDEQEILRLPHLALVDVLMRRSDWFWFSAALVALPVYLILVVFIAGILDVEGFFDGCRGNDLLCNEAVPGFFFAIVNAVFFSFWLMAIAAAVAARKCRHFSGPRPAMGTNSSRPLISHLRAQEAGHHQVTHLLEDAANAFGALAVGCVMLSVPPSVIALVMLPEAPGTELFVAILSLMHVALFTGLGLVGRTYRNESRRIARVWGATLGDGAPPGGSSGDEPTMRAHPRG